MYGRTSWPRFLRSPLTLCCLLTIFVLTFSIWVLRRRFSSGFGTAPVDNCKQTLNKIDQLLASNPLFADVRHHLKTGDRANYRYRSMGSYRAHVWIENTDLCREKLAQLLIYVHSAANHFDRREIIRQTWASSSLQQRYRFKVMFVVARTTPDVQDRISNESKWHRDLLQGSFVDAYHNLTYKDILALKWIQSNCNLDTLSYVLKTDDDVYINVHGLFDLLKRYFFGLRGSEDRLSRTYLCSMWPKHTTEILRGKAGECYDWCIEDWEFKGHETWPMDYCAGMGYLFTTDLVRSILRSPAIQRPFRIQDVFMTGVLSATLEEPPRFLVANRHYRLVPYDKNRLDKLEEGTVRLPVFLLVHTDAFGYYHWLAEHQYETGVRVIEDLI